jgi:hypothetical protein
VIPVRIDQKGPFDFIVDTGSQHEDGLLPTVLFQRVFISAYDHYVIFDLN